MAAPTGADRFPPEVTGQHSSRVFGLDLLRASAIGLVYLAHGSGVLMPHLPWWMGFMGHFGFYGVELFFVLSGFLIGGILIRGGEKLRERRNLLAFYIRRWFRTLPLFFLFLALNVALASSLWHQRFTFFEVATHALFLRNLTGLHMTFFGESWSLAIEEWFYLLFPLSLAIALRFGRRFDRVLPAVALGFFLFSNLGRIFSALAPYATWTEWQRKIVFLRFDGLMLGVFAAWLAIRFPNSWRKWAGLAAATGLLLVSAMYATLWNLTGRHISVSADDFFARTFRFTLVSLGFALLLPLSSRWRVARENMVTRNVHRIALWSYALYFVHTPVIAIMTSWVYGNGALTWPRAWGFWLLQTALCLTISALLYRFFESPCTHLRDKVAPRLTGLPHARSAKTPA